MEFTRIFIMYYVYLHVRLTDDFVFYVGKGKANRAWDGYNTRNIFWKNVVSKHGYKVEIAAFDLSESDALCFEIQLISFYKSFSPDKLTNLTNGGEGIAGYKFTKNQKLNLSNAQTQRYKDKNARLVQKEASVKAWADEELRLRQKIRMQNLWANPDFRNKTLESKNSQETKDLHKLKMQSLETKAKLKATAKVREANRRSEKGLPPISTDWNDPQSVIEHRKRYKQEVKARKLALL
jgi:hypothetical protein